MEEKVVKSSKRVLEIFETFAKVEGALSLSSICDMLHYPQSSAAALMKSLVLTGYMTYDRKRRTYLPTTRIAGLGRWIEPKLSAGGATLQIMQRLSDRTGHAITLCVQNDLYVQSIHTIESTRHLRIDIKTGTMRLLSRMSTGRALLSGMPDEEIATLLRRMNSISKADQRVTLHSLMEDIEQIRRRGYAFTNGMVVPGAAGLAILLPKAHLDRMFVVGVHGFVDQLEAEKDLILRTFVDAQRMSRSPGLPSEKKRSRE